MALIAVMVVLSLFKGEGGGWLFMFVGAPSIVIVIVQHWHCVVLVACPHHRISSSSSCVLTVLLSHAILVILPLLSLPCPHCDMLFGCHVTVSDVAPVLERSLGGGR